MKPRSAPTPDHRAGARPTGHESLKTIALVSLAALVAFAACTIDDSNDPLKNEAPNRGGFLGGISIGAAASSGTGGAGAGLGTGGTGGAVADPANCACILSYSSPASDCASCFLLEETSDCATAYEECRDDTAGCPAFYDNVTTCPTNDVDCIRNALLSGAANAKFVAAINCQCSQCTLDCDQGLTCQ